MSVISLAMFWGFLMTRLRNSELVAVISSLHVI